MPGFGLSERARFIAKDWRLDGDKATCEVEAYFPRKSVDPVTYAALQDLLHPKRAEQEQGGPIKLFWADGTVTEI